MKVFVLIEKFDGKINVVRGLLDRGRADEVFESVMEDNGADEEGAGGDIVTNVAGGTVRAASAADGYEASLVEVEAI